LLDYCIVGKVYAGDEKIDENLDTNDVRSAIYVTTGAVVPNGFDAVIPIEDTAILHDYNDSSSDVLKMKIVPSKVSSILNETKPWTWIRKIGSDVAAESIVLSKGEKIRPVHLALLAQLGAPLDVLQVKTLPRIGVLSTGNELVDAYESSKLKSNQLGKIPDANRPLLLSQLGAYGNCAPTDLGIVTDDDGIDAISSRLNQILWGNDETEGIDVLVATGGISMGEKDIMERVFVRGMGGKVHFGRMNMKPGKPTTFITIDKDHSRKLVFALPGNPVSASVCCELLVRPCLELLHNGVDIDEIGRQTGPNFEDESTMREAVKYVVENANVHEEVVASITSDIKLDMGRPEYHRVTLNRKPIDNNSGQYIYQATSTGQQRSSIVLSLRNADGLMMLPRGGPMGCGSTVAKKGESFPVFMFSKISSSIGSGTKFKDSSHRPILDYNNDHVHNKREKLMVGVVICLSEKDRGKKDVLPDELGSRIVRSLGGESKASITSHVTCIVPTMAKAPNDNFANKLSSLIHGPAIEGSNVIFVVVASKGDTSKSRTRHVAFRTGLEVNHALAPIIDKHAHALALQVRKGASSQDGIAAMFENVVGTLRERSSLIITCSDIGLERAIGAMKGSLFHAVSVNS